jgi:acetyl esterase/lipase
VLINLHGGGFFRGWRNYSVLESVPIAAKGGFKVVSVDYRQAPDNRFPAATEDVAAVYKALLKTYKAQNIGIYGCSAGGILTFEALAWFQGQGLPKPGAIGIMGAGGMAEVSGDSLFFGQALSGRPLPQDGVPKRGLDLLNLYFDAGSARDADQSPVYYPQILRKFPPSLILNATRDLTMSDAIFTHRALVKAGASSELHIWDGVGHCFEYDPRLPESQEAYQLLIQFFERHLGR